MKINPLFLAALGLGVAFSACSSSPDDQTSSSSSDCHMGEGGSGSTPAELASCAAMTAVGSSCCDANFEAYCFHTEVFGNQSTATVFRCDVGGWQKQVGDIKCDPHTSAEWTALNGMGCATIGQVCTHGGDTDGPMEPLVIAVCGGNGLWTVK